MKATEEPERSKTIKVLHVDDDPYLLEVTQLILESTGEFTIQTETSAEKGLSYLSRTGFDAIISDYQMPGMDGLAFHKKVRSVSVQIPFILFTGKTPDEIVPGSWGTCPDFYLCKGEIDPTFEQLASTLRSAVRRRPIVPDREKTE